MISEVVKCIQKKYSRAKRIGLLATSGTISSEVYNEEIESNDLSIVLLSEEDQKKLIDDAIYNEKIGIKSNSNPVHSDAKMKISLAKILHSSSIQSPSYNISLMVGIIYSLFLKTFSLMIINFALKFRKLKLILSGHLRLTWILKWTDGIVEMLCSDILIYIQNAKICG